MLFRWTLLLLIFACQTGGLHLIGSFPTALKEASAAEVIQGTQVVWTLEDKGNDSDIHAFDLQTGKRIKSLKVNAPNEDWEDLTSDQDGHLYIGDLGNNDGKRNELQIYKLPNPLKSEERISVLETTIVEVPKKLQHEDFEAFFIWGNYFYLFSKNPKKAVLLKIPTGTGKQQAEVITYFKLKGDGNNKITSASISPDGKKVVLLNHDKAWILTDFQGDDFFSGKVDPMPFEHTSQKEGVCFWENKLIITDERKKSVGGNIYSFDCSLNSEK